MPLTVCPFSNVKLRVVPELRKHNVAQMLRRGLFVTINSDDPAYFGGYIGDNYVRTARALGLTRDEMFRVARNSFSASFLPEADKQRHLQAVDDYAARIGLLTVEVPLRRLRFRGTSRRGRRSRHSRVRIRYRRDACGRRHALWTGCRARRRALRRAPAARPRPLHVGALHQPPRRRARPR